MQTQTSQSESKPRRLVMKFGGTSVGSVQMLEQAASIVKSYQPEWPEIVVVVSAMSGVTDRLLESARLAVAGEAQKSRQAVADLQTHHNQTITALFAPEVAQTLMDEIAPFFEDLQAYCTSIEVLREITPRGLDAITSLGERINARVVSALLRRMGLNSQAVDATDLIVSDSNFQNAAPFMDATRKRVQKFLLPILTQGIIPVVTGFIAANEDGVTTTLGRGGSDYTASILGVCADADEVWTWTDVDGVLSADPRIVPEARVIPEISYAEVSELAYFGAKVLHPKTIRPIIDHNLPLWVKNTFNPQHPGTKIVAEANQNSGKVTGVTAIRNLSLVAVEGRGIIGVPGIAARTFSAVAEQGASVLMISQSSSEQSICFVIPSDKEAQVKASIEDQMALELARRDIDRVWTKPDVVIVSVVGAGLRHTPGLSAKIFTAMGRAGINVFAVAQGSSDCSVSLLVSAEEGDRAVRAIHQETVINGKEPLP